MEHREKKKYSVAVFTSDAYLYQKIKLDVYEDADTIMCKEYDTQNSYDMVLIDADDVSFSDMDGIRISRHKDSDAAIHIPFHIGEIRKRLTGGTEKRLVLKPDTKTVVLDGKRIKLTDMEYALLTLLVENSGDFVSREQIIKRVWNDTADGGVVNVYVHYLREKLEYSGEKIILSSRKNGYKINENYLGGQDA